MHRGDQSNFVASNIKHREFSNLVSVRKSLAQWREIQKSAFSHNRVPPSKRRFGVRMFFRELVQALSRNDVHYGGATLAETFSDEKGFSGAAAKMFDVRGFMFDVDAVDSRPTLKLLRAKEVRGHKQMDSLHGRSGYGKFPADERRVHPALYGLGSAHPDGESS
jgi:hypothetical protein